MKHFIGCFDSVTDKIDSPSGVSTSKAAAGPEFKERNVLYTRRGAMRRRVHQVNFICLFIVLHFHYALGSLGALGELNNAEF